MESAVSVESNSLPNHFWGRVGAWISPSFKIGADIILAGLSFVPYGLLLPLYRFLYRRHWDKTADAIKLATQVGALWLLGGVFALISQMTLAVFVGTLLAPAIWFGGILKRSPQPYEGQYGLFLKYLANPMVYSAFLGAAAALGVSALCQMYYPMLAIMPLMTIPVGIAVSSAVVLLVQGRKAWRQAELEIKSQQRIQRKIAFIHDYNDFPEAFSDALIAQLMAKLKAPYLNKLSHLTISDIHTSEDVAMELEANFQADQITAHFKHGLTARYEEYLKWIKENASNFSFFKENNEKNVTSEVIDARWKALDEKIAAFSDKEISAIVLSSGPFDKGGLRKLLAELVGEALSEADAFPYCLELVRLLRSEEVNRKIEQARSFMADYDRQRTQQQVVDSDKKLGSDNVAGKVKERISKQDESPRSSCRLQHG